VSEIHKPGEVDYLEVGWKIPDWRHVDIAKLVILVGVLGGWRGFSLFASGGWTPRANRLYRGLVETKLASDARAGFELRLDPSLLSVSATLTRGVKHAELEKKLDAIVRKLKESPPSATEMGRARELVRAWNRYEVDGVTLQGFHIGQLEALGSRESFPQFLETVESVTPEDVREAAATYLVDSGRTTIRYHSEGAA